MTHVLFCHIMNECPQQSELPVFEGFLAESVRITLVDASYWAISALVLIDSAAEFFPTAL